MAHMITLTQAAARYGVSVETIINWSRGGRPDFPQPRWDEYELRRWDTGQLGVDCKMSDLEANWARMVPDPSCSQETWTLLGHGLKPDTPGRSL